MHVSRCSVLFLLLLLLLHQRRTEAGKRGNNKGLKPCPVLHELRVLDPDALRQGVELTVDDSAQEGELLATFEAADPRSTVRAPVEPHEYVNWDVRGSILTLKLAAGFREYETLERSPVFSIGPFHFECPGGRRSTLQWVRLRIRDSNNHAPEFEDPEGLVFLVNFPLRPGDLLTKVGLGPPTIRAFDIDLTNKNISFSVIAVHGRRVAAIQAVYVAHDQRNTWPVHIVDLRMRVKIDKPFTVTLLAKDTGIPPQVTPVTIHILDIQSGPARFH